jgi:glyoxylase-like metal-dependent hydrolase (beta-lactamase superfamily II)
MNSPLIRQTVVAKGAVDTNCYIVGCPETKAAAIIDPGAFSTAEVGKIMGLLEHDGLAAEYIINTHGHIDHIAGNGALQKATGAEILIHRADAGCLSDPGLNGSRLFGLEVVSPPPARLLEDGDAIGLGRIRFQVLHIPGHTPGCIGLLVDGTLFSGDTLFAGSVGRTDLPGGSDRLIIESIARKLMVLPDDTSVRPGHGPRTTIGAERQNNPFLN